MRRSWRLLIALAFLCAALSALSGCATPIQIQHADDDEFQKKLHRDPKFQHLIEQLRFPKDDKLHPKLTITPRRHPDGAGIGVDMVGSILTTW